MVTTRDLRLSVLGVLGFAAGLSAAPWTVTEQPDLARELTAAPVAKIESLGTPVRSVTVADTMLVPNPDGKTYDILQWYFKDYNGPTFVYIVDTATGEVKRERIPDQRQINVAGRTVGKDGRLYIATPDRKAAAGMEVYVYDPATNALTNRGIVVKDLGWETRPLTTAPDGTIYGTGSYVQVPNEHPGKNRVGIYKIDPQTGAVTDYGPVGPKHIAGGAYGYTIAAAGDWVYVASGKIPWYLVAYNTRMKEERVLMTVDKPQKYLAVQQFHDGAGAFVRTTDPALPPPGFSQVEYWLHDGAVSDRTEANRELPPWGKRAVAPAAAPTPEVSHNGLDPDPDGNAVLWYRLPADRVKFGGIKVTPETKPEDVGWRGAKLTDVKTYPAPIWRVKELPDGRIFGSGGNYLGHFLYDPATKKTEYLGKEGLSHYSTAIAGGKVYMSGYPSSPLWVYDPAKPWTVGVEDNPLRRAPNVESKESNPRMLGRFNVYTRSHKMEAAVTGADGCVYFGGVAIRDGSGGGLGWYNPAEEKMDGIWKPLSSYRVMYLTSACDGRYVVASTQPTSDDQAKLQGRIERPDQGQVIVFDTRTHGIVRRIEPVAKAGDTGPIVGVGGARVMGLLKDPEDVKRTIMYGVDVETGEVLFRKTLAVALPVGIDADTYGYWDCRMGPDGHVWTYFAGTLVRIRPDDGKVLPVARGPSGRMAFSGADLYLSGREELRVVRGVLASRAEAATGAAGR